MNYRHAFHAGNFADVVKHAALARILALLGGAVEVIDTHAGAGPYDLEGPSSKISGEAKGGILRLVADPAAPEIFTPLLATVRALNRGGLLRFYPGSPAVICNLLNSQSRLEACELRPDDFELLSAWMGAHCLRGRAWRTDGFTFAANAARGVGQLFVHIDPPYEQPGDYERAVEVSIAVTRARQGAVVMIWTPLKDLETFDRFLRLLEAGATPPGLVAQVRLRPLTNPMAMNGCALVILNPPRGLEVELETICGWAAQCLGEKGASAQVGRLRGG